MAEPPTDPLLAELRDVAARADPVPSSVLAGAKAAFSWRTIDAELAELTADSVFSGAGVRSADAARLLTFEGPGLEVEVEVTHVGALRRLNGQLVPPGEATVTVRWTDGSSGVDADQMGRFSVDAVRAGAVSIEVRRSGSLHPIVTSWVSI
jgi:hypothetical protein